MCFDRDGDQKVIILEKHWYSALTAAAAGVNMTSAALQQVRVDPLVTGELGQYVRRYGGGKEVVHEAFMPGTVVHIRFEVAAQLGAFTRLLRAAGKYRGISPYGWNKGFGRYRVLSVSAAGASPGMR